VATLSSELEKSVEIAKRLAGIKQDLKDPAPKKQVATFFA